MCKMRRYRRLLVKFIILIGLIVCISQVVFRVWLDIDNKSGKSRNSVEESRNQKRGQDNIPEFPKWLMEELYGSSTSKVVIPQENNIPLPDLPHSLSSNAMLVGITGHALSVQTFSTQPAGLSKLPAPIVPRQVLAEADSPENAQAVVEVAAADVAMARKLDEAQIPLPVPENSSKSSTRLVMLQEVRTKLTKTVEKDVIPLVPPETNAARTRAPAVRRNNSVKIDWHDHELIQKDKARTGLGEQGEPVYMSVESDEERSRLFKANGFNAYLSQQIAVDRAIPDIRHPHCQKMKYLSELPTVSVIFPFHNENRITLIRSIESILNRSPAHLIKEIILVDDCSTQDDLKESFSEYLYSRYGGKVKVLRETKREGLIRTRLAGARKAVGQVLVFLDSHIEAGVNWLPPLLEPIAEDYRTVVCPFIDVIDMDTFAYRAQDEGRRGAFDWLFYYKRLPRLPEDASKPAKPFWNPVMAGGLFAIDARWFWELGGYDSGLEVWGGEQYELSFKIWMCGGKMVDAPCSRIGHVYRRFNPHGAVGKGNYVMRNYKRVAEVWMDEYKNYLYGRSEAYNQIDAGDLSEQKALRKRLQCKSFKWFMTEIAFDLPKHYPMVEPSNVAEGEIRSLADRELCIDTKFRSNLERFGLEKCARDDPEISGEQNMVLSWHNDIRPGKRALCFDVSQTIDRAPVILFDCHNQLGNQWWKYNVDTLQLLHVGTKQCLDCDTESREVFTSHCNSAVRSQQWKWSRINETVARQMWIQG